jgi:hypothetical protein
VIRVVLATQVEQDYADPNWSIKKGEWFCMAVETADDLGENQLHRVWLFILRFLVSAAPGWRMSFRFA